MGAWQSIRTRQLLGATTAWLILWSIEPVRSAAGECQSERTITCFECRSTEDVRCHDPFNYTLHKRDMPKTRECKGCCVKMLLFIGTEHYQVRRTCTDELDVNFFMVNHACMTEGHRHGRMCFCETDECNGVSALGVDAVHLAATAAFVCWLLLSHVISAASWS